MFKCFCVQLLRKLLRGHQLQKWMHQMRHDKQQTEKYSEFEDSLILNEKQCRCLRRKVRERLPLIQLIVSESCLCFISANTRLLLQHTINYSTFSTRMWGGAREKWMTKSAERGWSVAEVICEPFSCRPHKLNVQSYTRLSPSLSCPLILKHSPCTFLSTPPSASLLLHHFRSSAWQPNCVCP